jgi:hypothetical protein
MNYTAVALPACTHIPANPILLLAGFVVTAGTYVVAWLAKAAYEQRLFGKR